MLSAHIRPGEHGVIASSFWPFNFERGITDVRLTKLPLGMGARIDLLELLLMHLGSLFSMRSASNTEHIRYNKLFSHTNRDLVEGTSAFWGSSDLTEIVHRANLILFQFTPPCNA